MKKYIRILLLFALSVSLLLGALALFPFSASAEDPHNILIKTITANGGTVNSYGSIQMEGREQPFTAATIGQTAVSGSTVTLTVNPNEGFTFLGWSRENPPAVYIGGNTYSFTMPDQDVNLFAVFEIGVYNVYYVGAIGTSGFPEEVMAKYGTDLEYHPVYNRPANPTKHNYGTATTLPGQTDMVKDTHTFQGWKAYNASGEEIALNGNKIPGLTSGDIYLVPQWTPVSCEVTRIDRCGVTELGRYKETVNYGTAVSGKELGGAKDYVGYWFDDADPANYTEATAAADGSTVVYRNYTPCEYQVTFNLNAPDENAVTDRGTEQMTVVFQEDLPDHIDIPACTGWEFLGYYITQTGGSERLYYDASGNLGSIKRWILPRDETMTAKWKLQEHEVVVSVVDENGNDCSGAVEILINGSAAPGAMEYGTQGTISVSVLPGQNKKLTKWNGVAIAHTTAHTDSFTIGEENFEITVLLLSAEPTPALRADYGNEKLEGFAPGVYRVTSEGGERTITVAADGGISAAGIDAEEAVSISDLLGKEIQIVRLGVSDQTADSDVQNLAFAVRPGKVSSGEYRCEIVETKRERSISFRGNGVYELAYTTSADEEPANWTTELRMENLEIETPYTVYLRVRASENAPHGEATKVLESFEFSHLVNLKPLFIILLCLLALQILALAFLLVSRRRARMNAVAAPLVALLAVKAIPAGLFPWIIVLLVAIVILQVVLVYLSLQTGVIWKKRAKRSEESNEDENNASSSAGFTLFGDEPKKDSSMPGEPTRNDQPDQPDENNQND